MAVQVLKMAGEMIQIKALMTGKWKLYKRENYDEYLKTISLNDLEKTLARNVKPKLKLWVDDDGETIVMKFKTGILNDTVRFKLGEEYEKEYLGHKGKGTSTWKDGKMYAHIKIEEKEHLIVREIINGDLVSTFSCEGVEYKAYFKRKEWKKK